MTRRAWRGFPKTIGVDPDLFSLFSILDFPHPQNLPYPEPPSAAGRIA
jgi:hypothetical protein